MTRRIPEATAAPVDAAERRKARFERLVHEHHDFVWRCARRLGVRTGDLDDVVQEVFLKAARNLDSITHERGFLFRACAFAAAHARRSVQRRREVVDDELVGAELDGAANPEETVETNQQREQLQRMLDALPTELREVFVLFELENFTKPEVAQALNLPPGTAASRLRRAREEFMIIAARVVRTGGSR
ncbi:MAG: sigma-70 family RNA polymerase sigma factor [Myxococcales bacterium]|nr:sigma-70 family RNA polymerase sigma factor [Myxococcales bacterium]